jgi:hypothetical protein
VYYSMTIVNWGRGAREKTSQRRAGMAAEEGQLSHEKC